MPSKYPSTLLPSRMEVVEMRKAVLDLLRKINAEAQYAYDHGLGLWTRIAETINFIDPTSVAVALALTGLELQSPEEIKAKYLHLTDAAFFDGNVNLERDGSFCFLQLLGYRSSAGTKAAIRGIGARGTKASPAALLAGDIISDYLGRGYNGSAFTGDRVGIQYAAAENWTPAANGTYINFRTRLIGSSGTPSERVRILDNGRVGINVVAPAAELEVVAPAATEAARFGDGTNRSAFENDGTLRFDGTATVYNDIYASLDPKTTGAGKPTLRAFNGNINAYTMAVNDISELDACELLHDWKEGTAIELHVHWASRGVDATNRGVKWQIDYTWANMLPSGAPTAFPAVQTPSAETQIPANTPDKTHFYTSVVSFTPVGGKIGANVMMSLKRIASVVNAAPTNDPWIMMVGIHYEIDTVGSRSISSK